MTGPRLDRLASLYLVAPFSSRTAHGIPVLMYHSIADGTLDQRHPYFQTATSLAVFEAQLRFLRDNGYKTVGLREAFGLLAAPERWGGAKYAVLTFDDGFENFSSNAVPLLHQYGATATMYLPTSFIGDSPLQFSGLECLTWKRVRELMQEGFAFGSHSVTHKRLYSLDAAGLDYELRVSKEMIEQNTSTPVDSFAYPSAFPEADPRFVQRFKDLLVKNGYQYAVNTIIGTAMRGSDPLLVRRLPVNSWDDEPLFRAKLNGAYDWLRTLQYAGKRLRRGLSHAA